MYEKALNDESEFKMIIQEKEEEIRRTKAESEEEVQKVDGEVKRLMG